MVVSVTGELIGVEYLYQQTNQVLEDVSLDPDAPDEAAAVDTIADDDEGIVVDEEDPTVFDKMYYYYSVDVKKLPGSLLMSSLCLVCPQEEMQGPDGQPGYQHVLKLARALLEARNLQGLSDARVDRLIALWHRLPEGDKQRVVYPPRHREGQQKGRFKAAKGKDTSCPGKQSLQR